MPAQKQAEINNVLANNHSKSNEYTRLWKLNQVARAAVDALQAEVTQATQELNVLLEQKAEVDSVDSAAADYAAQLRWRLAAHEENLRTTSLKTEVLLAKLEHPRNYRIEFPVKAGLFKRSGTLAFQRLSQSQALVHLTFRNTVQSFDLNTVEFFNTGKKGVFGLRMEAEVKELDSPDSEQILRFAETLQAELERLASN